MGGIVGMSVQKISLVAVWSLLNQYGCWDSDLCLIYLNLIKTFGKSSYFLGRIPIFRHCKFLFSIF